MLPAVPHGLAMLVQGLLSLHQQGRAHGDIKPDNIRVLLGADSKVLHCTLVDLGSSVVYSGEQHNTAANSGSMSTAALLSKPYLCCDQMPRRSHRCWVVCCGLLASPCSSIDAWHAATQE